MLSIMPDLEDSVPQEVKEDARMQVVKSLQTIGWQKKTVSIRINGLDTPCACRDLLEIIEGAGGGKVHSIAGIADYSASVGARLVSISGHGDNEADISPGHRRHFALSRIVLAAKQQLRGAIAAASLTDYFLFFLQENDL